MARLRLAPFGDGYVLHIEEDPALLMASQDRQALMEQMKTWMRDEWGRDGFKRWDPVIIAGRTAGFYFPSLADATLLKLRFS